MSVQAAISTISELRKIGYVLSLDAGKIHCSYNGVGEPPWSRATTLLADLREHKEKAMKLLSIDPKGLLRDFGEDELEQLIEVSDVFPGAKVVCVKKSKLP